MSTIGGYVLLWLSFENIPLNLPSVSANPSMRGQGPQEQFERMLSGARATGLLMRTNLKISWPLLCRTTFGAPQPKSPLKWEQNLERSKEKAAVPEYFLPSFEISGSPSSEIKIFRREKSNTLHIPGTYGASVEMVNVRKRTNNWFKLSFNPFLFYI